MNGQRTTRRLKAVGVGGTFDELHKGHRALLLKAFEAGETVQIGLCTDEFVRKLGKNHEIAPYEEREKEIRSFLEKTGSLGRAEIIPISTSHGTADTSKELEAIVVSQETERVALDINRTRKQNGLPPLKVFTITMVPAENHVSISSTRIRHGEIDREGHMLEKTK